MIFISTDRQGHNVEVCSIVADKDWATRHCREGDNWIKNYWKSYNHPHRSFLVEKMCNFSPIHSILEIGCASGPNLYNLAKKFPNAEIKGIDINPLAVQEGNKWLKKEGILNVQLEVGQAQALGKFKDKSFDIVFTDAVLIYLSPNEIRQVIREMLRIGRVLVLNEWHSFNKWLAWFLNIYYCLRLKPKEYLRPKQQSKTLGYSLRPESAALGYFVGHWVRDYEALLGEFVPKEKIRVTKFPKELWNDKNWQRWGAVIEVVEAN